MAERHGFEQGHELNEAARMNPSAARLRFDRFELDESEARLTRAGEPRDSRAETLRCPLRTSTYSRPPRDQERAARPRLGSSLRQRVGAQDGHQRPARSARPRSEAAALHRDGVAPRLSLHRRCDPLAHAGGQRTQTGRSGQRGPARFCGAHGAVPPRCRARRPHPGTSAALARERLVLDDS